MSTQFTDFILNYPGRLAMPIGVYAGLEMTGASVRQAVCDPAAQSQAVLALHRHFQTPVMLTATDLSAEAEAFGCTIRMPEDEIPTVIGRLASSLSWAWNCAWPHPRLRLPRPATWRCWQWIWRVGAACAAYPAQRKARRRRCPSSAWPRKAAACCA